MTVRITYANPDNGSVYIETIETTLRKVDFIDMLNETVDAATLDNLLSIEFIEGDH